MSTVVSIVDPDGTLAKDDCIDSGTMGGKLSMTFRRRDAAVPSLSAAGELWLIDRGNAALTILQPSKCEVRGQVSVSTGFKSNPHDVTVVSETKAYVTRYEANARAADDMSKGDDVLVIESPERAPSRGRIDLTPEATSRPTARPSRRAPIAW
jgi:hypothetical protein